MPCYSEENVNAQRGEGVFDASITALQRLNALGYGIDPQLPLHLVFNPNGAKLPPPQAELEADYKRELRAHFGIDFNRLYTITNLPVSRFASWLRHNGKYEEYMDLLIEAFNPATIEGLMCRDTINVSWLGEVFDCDFNQMMKLHLGGGKNVRRYLWEIDLESLEGDPIATGDHCFGCTAVLAPVAAERSKRRALTRSQRDRRTRMMPLRTANVRTWIVDFLHAISHTHCNRCPRRSGPSIRGLCREPHVGDLAPAFSLRTLDDKIVELDALASKQPVVLVVLRGWPGYQCPICTRQVHDYVTRAAEFAAKGARVIMVYPGPAKELKTHAKEFLANKEWPRDFLYVLDPDYAFTNAYGLRWDAEKETAYPSTFIIDRTRRVRFAHVSKSHGNRLSARDALAQLDALE